MEPKTERRAFSSEEMMRIWQDSQKEVESGYRGKQTRYDQPVEGQ